MATTVKKGMVVQYRDARGYWHNATIVNVDTQDQVDLRVPHASGNTGYPGAPALINNVPRMTARTQTGRFFKTL